MNIILEMLNKSGLRFVEFASPMLIQSSILILILLATDFLLRKKVRAVFRYWIWMLVLVKLMLPVSLYSPLSLGSLFGEKIEYANLTQEDIGQRLHRPENTQHINPVNSYLKTFEPRVDNSESLPNETSSSLTNSFSTSLEPTITVKSANISWQAVLFIIWIVIAAGLGLVLLKRTIFIKKLITKAADIDFDGEKSVSPNDVLKHCCQYLGLKKQMPLKISPDATSPVVCGLLRPVILLPQNLISSLSPNQLKAIFFHELTHVKRGDLWVNLLQTLMQIIYFYNPLLWLANSIIRRTREQAVDEMVLVAMGKDAREYPETLLNVAKLAFKRPALSLRLIGVVESEDALTGRIKHILNRPIPKNAKLGIMGLIVIILAAAILVPMGKKSNLDYFVDTTKGYIRCNSDISELGRILINMAHIYEFKQEFASSTGFGSDESPVKYSTTNYIIPDNKKLSIEAVAENNQPLIIQINLESGALYSLAEITTELARQLGIFSKATSLINKSETSLSIELLGVSEHPGESNQWWKPDGSSLEKRPYGTIKGDRVLVYNNKEKAYEFVVSLDGDNSDIVKWKTEPSDGSYMTSYPATKDNKLQKDLRVLVTRIPAEQKNCTLEINTESWFTLVKVIENQHTYAFGDFTALVIPPKYENGKYVIKVQETDKEFDNRYKRRYVIKLKDSETLVNLESFTKQTSYNEGELRMIETIYTLDSGYYPDNIDYVAAQYGFTQTFTFKNVSLAAQHKTNVLTSSSGPGIPSFIYADLNKPPVPRLTELHTGVVKDKKQLYFHSVHPQTLWQILSSDKEHNPKWYFRVNGKDNALYINGQFAHSRYEITESFGFPFDLKNKNEQWADGDYSLSVVIKDTVWLDPEGKRHFYKELVTDPIEFKIEEGSFLSKTGQPIPGFSPKASLPNYGTIELVGVRKKSLSDQPWYSPDGLQKLDSSDEIFSHLSSTSGIVNAAETQTYEFFIHCALLSNTRDKVVKNKWLFEPEKGIPGAFFTSFSSGRHYFTASVALSETLNKTNLTFSVSNGQWKTISESDGINKKEISITHRGQKQNITLGELVEKDGSVFIEVKHQVKEMAAQIIVFEKNNNFRYPLDNVLDYADPNGNMLITKCKFDGMTKNQIDHYEFQVQPVDVVTFKDISLKNEFHTNPQITTTSITDKTPISDLATERLCQNSSIF